MARLEVLRRIRNGRRRSWRNISKSPNHPARNASGQVGSSGGRRSASSSDNREAERSPDHHLKNETVPGPKNPTLAAENPNFAWAPKTDNGTAPPFKYSFALAHKRIDTGGWTRQVTRRELPIAKTLSGVEMRLTAGGVRELHWHVPAEWEIMLYGHARITAVDNGVGALSATSVRATFGSSHQECRIRFKVWARTGASFCLSSTMATSMNSRLS